MMVRPEKFTHEDALVLWNLLEEVDAQIDLADEISEEFANKVYLALWQEEK